MAKFDIYELNYITASKSQNTFNITYCYTDDGMIRINDKSQKPTNLSVAKTQTFFGDIGEYDVMSDKYNSNVQSFYDMTNGMIIHNLYNVNKTKIKTTSKQIGSTGYQDIFVPYISNDFMHICQFKSYAYGLTPEYSTNPCMKYIQLNDYTDFDTTYHNKLSSDCTHTFLYPHVEEIDATCSSYNSIIEKYGDLSNSIISSIFCPTRDMLGICHNYIVELPEYGKYNNYIDGYIFGDAIMAKNHLNYQYSMNVDANYNLSACREYCSINTCGNQLYLTYRDNVNYQKTSEERKIYYQNDTNQLSINQLNMSKHQTQYSYQHVEVINSYNKFDNAKNTGHKSSMFSLKLHDTGLNESTIPENIKKNLRQNIVNNVRMIVENLIPANTQLFNIYFDGK